MMDGFKTILDFPITEGTFGDFAWMTVEYSEEDHTFCFIASNVDEAGNNVSSETYATLYAVNGLLETDSDFWQRRCLELAAEIDKLNYSGGE